MAGSQQEVDLQQQLQQQHELEQQAVQQQTGVAQVNQIQQLQEEQQHLQAVKLQEASTLYHQEYNQIITENGQVLHIPQDSCPVAQQVSLGQANDQEAAQIEIQQ